jgi:hypothetical protein
MRDAKIDCPVYITLTLQALSGVILDEQTAISKQAVEVPNLVRGCMFIVTGPTGSPPAELVRLAGNAASQMRPDVLSVGRVYKHATPDGVANVKGENSS